MTYDELKAAGFVTHHTCSICEAPVGFLIHPELAAAVFNSGCGCSDGDRYRILIHDELAEIPSVQS